MYDGFFKGCIIGILVGLLGGLVLAYITPERVIHGVKNVATNVQSYEVGWDIDDDTVYQATCNADRCRWTMFEYIGWTRSPGLVKYQEDTQIRRGQVVFLDTFVIGRLGKVETDGLSRLEKTDRPSKGSK